jgi:hypothetical protein
MISRRRAANAPQPLEDTVRLPFLPSRRLAIIAAAVVMLLSLGGAVTAVAAAHPGHTGPRDLAPAAGVAAGTAGTSPDQFHTTANPLTLDPPLQVPPTKPVVVTIANHAAFGDGPPPDVTTDKLPSGHWAQVVLQVTGTESGTQYDRLCEIFDGPTQLFLGVTPEPTPKGITWHVQKDITSYLPLLTGTQTFSTYVDNYTSTVDNGIPVITAKLLFYPAGGGYWPAQPAGLGSPALAGNAVNETGPGSPAQHPGVPTQVVPVLPSGATNTFGTINPGQTVSATVTLPDDITTASLDLYAVGQANDEFWWGENPGFREIDVAIDGKPAGIIWPYPYVYTGGVNPFVWRPITAIHTLDIPSYRVDLTPFAGMLGGTHTITLTVAGNNSYWLAGGSMMLTTDGQATTGGVVSDTLSQPTTSKVVTQYAMSSKSKPVTSESAKTSYQISGTLTQDGRTWTDTLGQQLQFGNDETNFDPTCSGPCYEWDQAEETQSSTETITGPGTNLSRSDEFSYSIGGPDAFLQNSTQLFLPANVSQQLTDVASQQGGFSPGYQTRLSESIMGYGALGEKASGGGISDGDTTGTITAQESGGWPGTGYLYQRTVVADGGVIVQDLTEPASPYGSHGSR